MSDFNPVKSSSHKGYRVEDDGSLTIQFKNGAYSADLEGDDNPNGKLFAEKIRQLPYTKLDR